MAVVFSSKLIECVLAWPSIVTDQVRGRTAVRVSPVCARLKPRVSRTGRRSSILRLRLLKAYTSHRTMTTVEPMKNQ